jgi:4-hydroxy-3-polyprenylbenzoate decarboxylase
VAITGASGSIYGIKLIEELLKANYKVYLIISSGTFSILHYETGIDWQVSGQSDTECNNRIKEYFKSNEIHYCNDKDLWSPMSSGSFQTQGMIVIPCSMKTLSAISNGYSANLIERSADVTIKEGRLLILCPRETPFSAIHLENMLKLARLGVKIIPPIPAFYHKPNSIDDIINFVVGKVLDTLNISHNLYKRWS